MRGQSRRPPSSLGQLVHAEADGRSRRGNAHAAQALLRHLRKESFFGEELTAVNCLCNSAHDNNNINNNSNINNNNVGAEKYFVRN